MTCKGCQTDGLFNDGHYCEHCYGKLYNLVDQQNKKIKELLKEVQALAAKVDRLVVERDAALQGSLKL